MEFNGRRSQLVLEEIQTERRQAPATRRRYYEEISSMLGKPLLSFCTSFHYPVMIDDSDVAMIEGVLKKSSISKGFCLLINSPGGSGLAAERIVNICRTYAGRAGYSVVVPGTAKSAATMICFGATEIIMSKSSELGPIDPQTFIKTNNGFRPSSLINLVKKYNQLFDGAIRWCY